LTAAPGFLTYILGFALVLGPLVLVHELGHYLVGRWFGVRADAFSIGFGKEIAGWTDRRGTRWKLSALPLGGYVQFAGDKDAMSTPDAAADAAPDTFGAQPLWQRALIVLAGPLTNLIVAVLVFAAFNISYGRLVAEPVVADFAPGSVAAGAGVERGDRITAINGNRIESITELPEYVRPYPGDRITLALDRGGAEKTVSFALGSRTLADQFGNEARIGSLGISFNRPVIGRVLPGSPADRAGLREGDRIRAIAGTPVNSFDDIPGIVEPRAGDTLAFVVERKGVRREIPVVVGSAERQARDGAVSRAGQVGIGASMGEVVPVGPVEAIVLGVDQSLSIMRMMGAGIVQIVTGQRSMKELGGPIKIAKYSGEQFSLGWQDFVGFVAMISINLAFINLLPIPGLDGGHLAFYAAEAVRRRPLGLRSQEWAIRTGVALVLTLMLIVTVNDLASLPIFGG
jgi:regulator of sigma E protease